MQVSSGRAALAWSMGASFFLYAFVQRVAPSVMVDDLMREFGVGAAAIGHLSAFYFYAYVSLQLPIGVLMDRIGPRRLMSGAALLAALGSLVFATSGGFAGVSAGRLLIGLGVAFSWVGVLMLSTQLFPPGRFAFLAGIGQAMGMFGAILGQAPLGALVATLGWRSAGLILAGVSFAIAIVIWLSAPNQPPRAEESHLLAGLARVARNKESWFAAAVAMTLAAPLLAFAGLWGVPFFGALHGMERSEAAALASCAFVGWALGAPVVGWLSDRLGKAKPLLIGGTVCAALSTAAIIYLPLPPWGTAFLLVIGGAAGSSMILTYAVARDHNAPQDAGAAYGFVNTATVGAGAIFQPLVGVLLDMAWDGTVAAGIRVYAVEAFHAALVVLPAACAIGLLLTLAMREPVPRR